MANYPKILMTVQGLSLISEANATGQALTFSKILLGDGNLESESIQSLTQLKSPKLELAVTGGTNLGSGQFQIRAVCSNASLDAGFFAREVGVYAKVGATGVEKLIAYTNGGNFVDYIPDKSVPIDSQIFKIDIVVGDTENVTVQVKDETYLIKAEMDEHNASGSAHENRFKLFEKIAELGDDLINKLALTSTVTAINVLQTDSWFGQLLKMVLNASGVKYNIAQNGYVCLGSFFGGLIMQWGSNEHGWVTFPIAFNSFRKIITNHQGTAYFDSRAVEYNSLTGFTLSVHDNSGTGQDAQWIAFGK
ncbi:MAG: phage tail protein [Dialister invisus]|nr:phage tail protein [Dialister invisus]